jgi:DNA-binding NarL/FixJ family response regulator
MRRWKRAKMRPRLVKNVSSVERRSVLTVRQQQVAVLVQQGLSNKEIARKLRLRVGFESHEARAIRRTSSITDAA